LRNRTTHGRCTRVVAWRSPAGCCPGSGAQLCLVRQQLPPGGSAGSGGSAGRAAAAPTHPRRDPGTPAAAPGCRRARRGTRTPARRKQRRRQLHQVPAGAATHRRGPQVSRLLGASLMGSAFGSQLLGGAAAG
jgi:hypothetical protein